MAEIQYKVCMHTPLGEKKGILTAEQNGGQLRGWLHILGHRTPFDGMVDKAGNCRITGIYTTLLRDVPYVAIGTLSSAAIHLQVKGERNIFELTGNTCPHREEAML